MKKVLIAFHSQSGNTEKIARAIKEELQSGCSIDIKPIDENGDMDLNQYEILFIGSPIITGKLSESVQNFIATLENSAAYRVAGFITHSSPVYSKGDYINGIKLFQDTCKKKGIVYAGSFNCQGFLTPAIHDMVKKMKKFTDKEWEENLKAMEGHPNNQDEDNAKKFAREIISLI